MKEENLNNVSNNVSELLLTLKENYNKRREYSQGYLEFINDNYNIERSQSQQMTMEYRSELTTLYHTYLKRVKKINDLGI